MLLEVTILWVPRSAGVPVVRGPGRPHATARTGWTKEKNVAVMECYFLSNPVDEYGKPIRGYRRRMNLIFRRKNKVAIQPIRDSVTKLE